MKEENKDNRLLSLKRIQDVLNTIPESENENIQFELDMFLARLELIEAKSISHQNKSRTDDKQIREDIYRFLKDDLVDFLHKMLAEEPLPSGFPDLRNHRKQAIRLLKELGVYVLRPSGKDYHIKTIPEKWLGRLSTEYSMTSSHLMNFLSIYRNRLYSLTESSPYGFNTQKQFMRAIISRDKDWDVSFSRVFRAELKLREEIMFALLRRFSVENRLNYLIGKEIIFSLSDSFIESLHNEVEHYFKRLLKVQKRKHSKVLAENEYMNREVDYAAKAQKKSIQQQLPENSDHIKFLLHYRPFMSLSGDFYRVHAMNDDEYSVVLCDIAGHGLSAAMYYNTLVHSYNKFLKYLDRPDKFMQKLDEELYGKLNDNFITGICVHIHLKKNRITYCNAGHPKAFLIKRSEEPVQVRFLRPNSRVLGVFKQGHFNTGRYSFDDPCRLVLYTDGITEAFDENHNMLTERGLLNLLKDTSTGDLRFALQSVLDGLSDFTGKNRPEDDCTMILADIDPYKSEKSG